MEGSLNWKLAIVKKINKFSVMIETEEEPEGYIELSSINWTKKSFEDLFEFGDLIYVKKIGRKLGFEILTLAPIEIELINFNLLTKREKNYLFNYHLKVYSKISPFLNRNEKKWLASFI